MVDIKRRKLIALMGGVAAGWPLAARAQQPQRMARIGYLGLAPAARMQPFDDAFRQGLRELGYVEGRNLRIEYRSASRATTRAHSRPGQRGKSAGS
jgi:putative ABC transport system substrate-binding protein